MIPYYKRFDDNKNPSAILGRNKFFILQSCLEFM